MRSLATLLTVAVIFAAAFADSPQETKKEAPSPAKPVSFWMEKKMDYTQEILRGLATEDFEKIGVNARQMRLLSKVEGFVRGGKPGYRTQLHTFENVYDAMIAHSDEKNLAGVTLAFNQMTVSCVGCHQSLRTPPEDTEPIVAIVEESTDG